MALSAINTATLLKRINQAVINSQTNLAYGAVLNKFKSARKELIEEFNDDEVTQEIESAEDSSTPGEIDNSSGLLYGEGNLFTFLGFEYGRKPVKEIRKSLEDINLLRKPKISVNKNAVNFAFPVETPDEEELNMIAEMDWENGNSWIDGIEQGVSGFSNYMYWKMFDADISRSTGGIQTKKPFRAATMATKDYLPTMFKRFLKRITA